MKLRMDFHSLFEIKTFKFKEISCKLATDCVQKQNIGPILVID
jgi:hypothetical protein